MCMYNKPIVGKRTIRTLSNDNIGKNIQTRNHGPEVEDFLSEGKWFDTKFIVEPREQIKTLLGSPSSLIDDVSCLEFETSNRRTQV